MEIEVELDDDKISMQEIVDYSLKMVNALIPEIGKVMSKNDEEDDDEEDEEVGLKVNPIELKVEGQMKGYA